MMKMSANVKGVSFLVLAALIIYIQNITVKWIGGDYSALQIVALRSLVALPCTLLFYRYEGRRGLPTTHQPRLEYLRGVFLFLSYTTFMMGLAALPLADIEAIRFSAPLMITLLSVMLLGEKVGPRRWLALMVGFTFCIESGSNPCCRCDARCFRALHLSRKRYHSPNKNNHSLFFATFSQSML